jgi:hypothetical protein
MKKVLMISLTIVMYIIISGCGIQTTESVPTTSPTLIENTSTPTRQPLIPEGFPVEGLIAYFPFNGDAQDFSGNDLQGILSGASLVTDRFGEEGALSFDGIDDYFIVNSPLLSAIKSDLTISMWVNTEVNDFTHLVIISSKPAFSDDSVFTDFTWHGDWLGFGYTLGRGGIVTYLQDNIYDGSWHHLVGVIQNGMLKFYVDGEQNSFKMGTAGFTDLQYVIIGNWLGKDGLEFPQVMVDDLTIYDRALSDNKIMALLSSGR